MTKNETQPDIDVELVTKATAELELQVIRDLQAEDKAIATLLDTTVFKDKDTDEDKDTNSE